MSKFKKLGILLISAIFCVMNTVPSVVYAFEVNNYYQEEQVNQISEEIDEKLSKPLDLTNSEIENLIQQKKDIYTDLSEEQMRQIAYKVLSPYATRASVWDGQGVTLSEFAFAFDVIVGGLISGYASLGKYAAAKGVSAARSMMSRAAKAAAQRVGVLTGFISKILGAAFAVINIYYNVGYALAQFIDARDYYPNNGRINAWA